MDIIIQGNVPFCSRCLKGIIKPSITFFGEKLPNSFEKAMIGDCEKVDMIIIIGTSLKVEGGIIDLIKRSKSANADVKLILFNRELITIPKR
jgi:NAD-dependent SIR2 family protein deacetylase